MTTKDEDQQLLLGPLPHPNVIVPSEINRHLKPCQQLVLRFLYTHYFQKDGGILNDRNEMHDVLPIVIFISALVNKNTSSCEKFLLIINEEDKIRLNLWLKYMKHVGIELEHIKYCGENTSSHLSASGQIEPCIYVVKLKRLDGHLYFIKKIKWTMIVYDHYSEKSSLTNILNYAKDLSSDSRFIVSKESVFHSKKYFWSLFKFIKQPLVLGKTWQEFDETGYQYYFNKVDETNDGKMSKMDIYKSLEATRIRFEYVSRSLTCIGGNLHAGEPWNIETSHD